MNGDKTTQSTLNLGPLNELIANFALNHRNSFGLDACAEYACVVRSTEAIAPLMTDLLSRQIPWRVLGGGSNVLLPERLPGVTLLMDISGQDILSSNDQHTLVAVGAGNNWHEFVAWTLENNLPGLENLALIPGTVGAAPIQNIGAYGVEVAQFIHSIDAFDCDSQRQVILSAKECAFSYRQSVFKKQAGRFIVSKVTFKLPKDWSPQIQYAELAQQFGGKKDHSLPSAEEIFVAVCKIRTRKLPDPKIIGNAGSFFENPIIGQQQFEELLAKHPGLVSYPEPNQQRKLAAGWLIDQCGFKGQRHGAAGVYEKQALVLVNHGGTNAPEILQLASNIQAQVKERFHIDLEIEPRIL